MPLSSCSTSTFSPFVVVVCFTLLFAYSIFNARNSIDHLHKAVGDWPAAKCRVESTSIRGCNHSPSEKKRFIVKVDVLNETGFSEPVEVPYYNDAPSECVPLQDIPELKDRFQANATVDCYVERSDRLVRLTKGGHSGEEFLKRRATAGLSVVVAIVFGLFTLHFIERLCLGFRDRRRGDAMRRSGGGGGLFGITVGAAFGRGRRRRRRRRDLSSWGDDNVMYPPPPPPAAAVALFSPPPFNSLREVRLAGGGDARRAARRPLSAADARALVDDLRDARDRAEVARATEDFAVCPICLDEDDDDGVALNVLLPCDHAYHESCALQWFRRGAPTCPYCKTDLWEHVIALREKSAGRGDGGGSGGADGADGGSGRGGAGARRDSARTTDGASARSSSASRIVGGPSARNGGGGPIRAAFGALNWNVTRRAPS